MKRSSPTRQRLAALALLGLPLLSYPLLALPEGTTAGIPDVFIYLFCVWGGLIGLAAWVAEGKAR